MRMDESRESLRLACWESVFRPGVIKGKCPICQCSKIRYKTTSGTTFQTLHIIPLSKGGPTQSWNLLPGCGCNQNMASLNLLDWMGTRGNKRPLLRPLFLSKYKSLVPEFRRSSSDSLQLLHWIESIYRPRSLSLYSDWLILTERDLRGLSGEGEEVLVRGGIQSHSPHFYGIRKRRGTGKRWIKLSGITRY